jgi:hypothetical protein
MTNSKINSGNITEHLGIVFVSINENGRCEITISEFKKLLAKAYQKGYEEASLLNSLSHTNTIPCEQNDKPTKIAKAEPIPIEEWDKLGY